MPVAGARLDQGSDLSPGSYETGLRSEFETVLLGAAHDPGKVGGESAVKSGRAGACEGRSRM
jgi:hypothetical protein